MQAYRVDYHVYFAGKYNRSSYFWALTTKEAIKVICKWNLMNTGYKYCVVSCERMELQEGEALHKETGAIYDV